MQVGSKKRKQTEVKAVYSFFTSPYLPPLVEVKRKSIALNADDVHQPTGITAKTIEFTRKSPRRKMKLLMKRCE